VIDPVLAELGGEVGYAGGHELAQRVGAAIPAIAPISTSVVAGTVGAESILRGALRVGLDAVREGLFTEETEAA
ncbi:MAG: ROK family transcriptional regulator, partial [Stackebrandtia sp.]